MNNTSLENKVQARNLVHAMALVWGPIIRDALKPFIGKNVTVKAGGKTAKLQKALDALKMPNDMKQQIIVRADNWWFRAEFRAASTNPHVGTHCASCTVNLGDIKDNVLVNVHDNAISFRVDYTAEEIKTAREAVAQARNVLQDAERRLCHFGEHDNS